MEEYFFNRYKGKTEEELQYIIDNQRDYQVAAVNAALMLLGKKAAQFDNQVDKKERVEKSKVLSTEVVSGIKKYPFLTISKILLTHLALSLLFLAIQESLNYFNVNFSPYSWLTILALLLLSQKIHYWEEGKTFTFKERVYNDFIFIIVLTICKNLFNFILYFNFLISDFWEMGIDIFFIFILAISIEGMVSLLRLFLKKLRCAVFLK
jgi:hypothetical protein